MTGVPVRTMLGHLVVWTLAAAVVGVAPAPVSAGSDLDALRLRSAAVVLSRAEFDASLRVQAERHAEVERWDSASAFVDAVAVEAADLRAVAVDLGDARESASTSRSPERLFDAEVRVARARGRASALAPLSEVVAWSLDEVEAALYAKGAELDAAVVDARTGLGARPAVEEVDLNAFFAAVAFNEHLEEAARLVTRQLGGNPEELAAVWSHTDPRRLTAVMVGLQQLGKPYVFAAHGPSAFDCSGFTTFAWRAAGVSLTPYSYAQQGETRALSMKAPDLRPGDLVFWDRGWSEEKQRRDGHVAMSLGYQNLLVEAHGSGSVRLSRYSGEYLSGFGRVGLRNEA
jgi:hypothetical protein